MWVQQKCRASRSTQLVHQGSAGLHSRHSSHPIMTRASRLACRMSGRRVTMFEPRGKKSRPTSASSTEDLPLDWEPTTAIWGRSSFTSADSCGDVGAGKVGRNEGSRRQRGSSNESPVGRPAPTTALAPPTHLAEHILQLVDGGDDALAQRPRGQKGHAVRAARRQLLLHGRWEAAAAAAAAAEAGGRPGEGPRRGLGSDCSFKMFPKARAGAGRALRASPDGQPLPSRGPGVSRTSQPHRLTNWHDEIHQAPARPLPSRPSRVGNAVAGALPRAL